MRFFQSESHSKPDDNTDEGAPGDNATGTGTIHSEPVPVPRSSEENHVSDGDTHRAPDAADRPHLSGGFDDTDRDPTDSDLDGHDDADRAAPAGGDVAADRPHISVGSVDTNPADTVPDDTDNNGRPDDTDRNGRPDDETDSSVRTGEPVDAEVVPDAGTAPEAAEARRDDEEPVFVEPVPQETAFGAATVGGAVAASEQAARREITEPDATDTVPAFPAEPTDAFGTPVSVGSPAEFHGAGSPHDAGDAPEAGAAQSPHDFGRAADETGDETGDDETRSAHVVEAADASDDVAAQSPHEWGRAVDPSDSPSEFGRAHDGTDSDGVTGADTDADREGFGPADERGAEPVEGFGPAGAADTGETGTDKPLRAEGVTASEGFGAADGTERLADEDRPEEQQSHTHAAETAALGVAAGVVAGAAVAGAAVKDRDRTTTGQDRDGDGQADTDTTATDRNRDGQVDTETIAKDRDGDGWIDAEPIANDRDGDGRTDGEPMTAGGTAAVPIEPIPVPADAEETPATVDEPVELLPGDIPEQPALAAFFSEGATGDFRDRWREVQLRFVDDPAQAASDAGTLIDEVVAALNAAVTEQREALGGTSSGQGDTEQLRVLVRRQRDFLDRILGL
ncbi:hypothetical protein J2S43_008278 [Catenuloplanes nepalensis]|uniref:Uncharacterized protein n=1 Tax=Catenuloplanes nepalensis TaxID=587533 RepID=A0ABT9N7U1_9ACTN|nr:hypothetical protein [Catenuloplanes nepalensis]MDP9799766.1 hypothetical protein [Catenuloplanes nepalensis]